MHMDIATIVMGEYKRQKQFLQADLQRREATPHCKLSKSYLIFVFLFWHKKQRPVSGTENPT